MKTTLPLILWLLVLSFNSGCKTPVTAEQAAYRTLGTVVVSVDGAMKAWGSYVETGQATVADEAAVKKAFDKYRNAMRVARNIVESIGSQPEGQAMVQTAIAAVSAASGELVQLITTLAFHDVAPSKP